MKRNKTIRPNKSSYLCLAVAVGLFSSFPAFAGNVQLVGNGSSSGPIITTSSSSDITLGTRLRVGTFTNTPALNSAITSFLNQSKTYAQTVADLNAIFVDLGTNVTNFGNSSQIGTGVSSSQFVFNNSFNVTVNGSTSSRVGYFGSIANVNYSSVSGLGNNSNVYIWTALNNEIGIFSNSNWRTPAGDLTGVTLNLSAITFASRSTDVLLGTYVNNATGSDFLALAVIPEPSSSSLVLLGLGLAILRSKKNKNESWD
jgi:hypothetical protein